MMNYLGVIFLSLVSLCAAHKVILGRCPNVPPMQQLDLDKFVSGSWYVLEVTNAINECLKMTFQRTGESTLTVSETREFVALNKANIGHTHEYTGTLTVVDANVPSKMTVKWPLKFLNVFGETNFLLVDTNYDEFAVIFECQKVISFARYSAAILSRTPELPAETVDKIKSSLESYGVEREFYSTIDHTNCKAKGEADFNFALDEDTFKPPSLGIFDEKELAELRTEDEVIDFIHSHGPRGPKK